MGCVLLDLGPVASRLLEWPDGLEGGLVWDMRRLGGWHGRSRESRFRQRRFDAASSG